MKKQFLPIIALAAAIASLTLTAYVNGRTSGINECIDRLNHMPLNSLEMKRFGEIRQDGIDTVPWSSTVEHDILSKNGAGIIRINPVHPKIDKDELDRAIGGVGR